MFVESESESEIEIEIEIEGWGWVDAGCSNDGKRFRMWLKLWKRV